MTHTVVTPLAKQTQTINKEIVWIMILMNGLILLTSSLWPHIGFVVLAMAVTAIFMFRIPECGAALVVNYLFLITILFRSSQLSGGVALSTQTLCLLGLILYALRRHGDYSIRWGVITASVVLLGVWLVIGYAFSTSKDYASFKIMRYFAFNLFYFFIPFFFWNDIHRLKRIYLFLFLIGLGVACVSFFIVAKSGFRIDYRFALFDIQNPIWYARALGVAVLAALFLAENTKNYLGKMCITCTIPFFLFFMILTASRGPFASLSCAILLYIVLKANRSPATKLASIVVVLTLITIMVLLFPKYQIQSRLAVTNTVDVSAGLRLYFWYVALRLFMGSPLLGIGTGSFASEVHGFASYPHNIVFELGAELGLIGLILIGIFIVKSLQYGLSVVRDRSRSLECRALGEVTSAFFVYTLLNAFVSGDITGNQTLWFSAGLTWVLYNTDG